MGKKYMDYEGEKNKGWGSGRGGVGVARYFPRAAREASPQRGCLKAESKVLGGL